MVLVFLIGGAVLFFTQKAHLDAAQRDAERKVAINAMYYNLEEVYYEQHGHYPQTIDSKTLRAMDPELFTDPEGYKLGDALTNYHYDSKNCSLDGKCKSYKLHSSMEREAEYEKSSRRQ